MAEVVRIDELCLSVPGLRPDEARRLGEELARRIADALPGHSRRERLDALDLRLTVPADVPRDRLADEIARAVIERLR